MSSVVARSQHKALAIGRLGPHDRGVSRRQAEAGEIDLTLPVDSPRVLVTGTDRWAADRAARALTKSGCEVLRCHDDDVAPGSCYALVPDRVCPLDAGFDVAVTIRPRPLPRPTLSEFGAVCAHRAGIPLVVAGNTVLNPFAQVATEVTSEEDLLATVTRVAPDRAPGDALNDAATLTSTAMLERDLVARQSKEPSGQL